VNNACVIYVQIQQPPFSKKRYFNSLERISHMANGKTQCMYHQIIYRIPYARKSFPLDHTSEMLLIIGGKGWKGKSLTLFAWLTITKKSFGQLSKCDLESLTHKCEVSQGEALLFKIKSCFEFWEKQNVDNASSNSNVF